MINRDEAYKSYSQGSLKAQNIRRQLSLRALVARTQGTHTRQLQSRSFSTTNHPVLRSFAVVKISVIVPRLALLPTASAGGSLRAAARLLKECRLHTVNSIWAPEASYTRKRMEKHVGTVVQSEPHTELVNWLQLWPALAKLK